MKAWLVTWDWFGDHAAVEDPLVAIFTSKRSDEWVVGWVESFYLAHTCTAEEMMYYANRKKLIPYPAINPMTINGIPHGSRIQCGRNPWLYARVVAELKTTASSEEGYEVVSWREPPIFRYTDERKMKIEVAKEGAEQKVKRKLQGLIQIKGIG